MFTVIVQLTQTLQPTWNRDSVCWLCKSVWNWPTMISYSTGTSGTGADVEKERLKLHSNAALIYWLMAHRCSFCWKCRTPKGTRLTRRANVFIFPDLNTGNTTYNNVQQM